MAREGEGFFDELARGLADGTLTRGRALRLMGAALVGGTLASLGIREAGADPPGCKRIGKNCTRNDQCCGSLVCVSGTCQTPTTTTTETPTTTTTSTTPMCIANGGTCSTGGTPCCSGNCSNGFCCPSGRVGLSNGTCAMPCTRFECPTSCGANPECVDAPGPGGYCGGGPTPLCTSDTDCLSGICFDGSCVCRSDTECPSGEFCSSRGFCSTAC